MRERESTKHTKTQNSNKAEKRNENRNDYNQSINQSIDQPVSQSIINLLMSNITNKIKQMTRGTAVSEWLSFYLVTQTCKLDFISKPFGLSFKDKFPIRAYQMT